MVRSFLDIVPRIGYACLMHKQPALRSTTERVDDVPLLIAQMDRMGSRPCWMPMFRPMAIARG